MTDENGAKVRPDMQTKLIGAVISLVFLGAIAWVGTTLLTLSERTVRIETRQDERNRAFLSELSRIRETLERVDMRLQELEDKKK